MGGILEKAIYDDTLLQNVVERWYGLRESLVATLDFLWEGGVGKDIIYAVCSHGYGKYRRWNKGLVLSFLSDWPFGGQEKVAWEIDETEIF